ncbi:unnamed protein product [Penicillium roqueforti FM164]|uniref:Genomic scaffold, ProqFM164S02 n=2 Tax=Penicillium roqueforti TaxID=5082 RepID=W6Q469_PENRF|nr:unnamed protein product [Penicillium roqueforti FM164]
MVSTPADLAKGSRPSSLRNVATPSDVPENDTMSTPAQEVPKRRPVPPTPPRRAVPKTGSLIDLDPSPSNSESSAGTSTNELPSSGLKSLDDNSVGTQSQSQPARVKPPPPPPRRTNTGSSTTSLDPGASTPSTPSIASTALSTPARPAAPATGIQSYPAAAAQAAYQGFQYASDRLNFSGSAKSPSNQSGRPGPNGTGVPPAPLPNKREELWRRRWARASEVLEQHDVVLGSWRVGSDAQPVCAWLMEQAMKDLKNNRSKGDH